jgi:hypothetical protein
MASANWVARQVKEIEKSLVKKYGAGWKYLSPEMRDAARSQAVLELLLGQAMEKYEPAQEMCQPLLAGLLESMKD